MNWMQKRLLGLVTAVALVFGAGATGVYAAPGDYDPGDMVAMNWIISQHSQIGLSSAPIDGSEMPADWAGIVETSQGSSGRRITGLNLSNRSLGGTLDVRALTALERLDCEDTEIQCLELDGLSALQSVACGNNEYLFLLTNPAGHTLNIYNVTGGYAVISGYDVAANEVKLTAVETGRSFNGWVLTPGGTIPRTNPLTVTLDADIKVIPQFILTEYYGGDVRVINAIIDNNGLKLTKADPDDGSYVPNDWKHVVNWNISQYNRQVVFLDLNKQELTGTLDVSGLSGLQNLLCITNQLTGLNVSELENLTGLNCRDNQLTSLDVTGLSSLENLNVVENQLESLDLSGLTSLKVLYISKNPTLVSLTTPAARKATVIPAVGGTAFINDYNCATNEAKLLALPDNNHSFTRWELNPGGNVTTSFATVSMDSDVTGTPVFTYIGSGHSPGPGTATWSGGGGSSGDDAPKPQQRTLQRVDVGVDGYTFTVKEPNLTKLALMRVTVDGGETSLYTARSGSVIVTLKPELVETLKPGKHRVRLEFLNHYGEADFTVNRDRAAEDGGYSSAGNTNANPSTGR